MFVYKIPPLPARGYRAADWSLASPDWTGRLRIMEANNQVGIIVKISRSGFFKLNFLLHVKWFGFKFKRDLMWGF